MHAETVINAEAQDHAVACALCAGLLGQWAPSFMRLPVLNNNLHEPPQSVALDNSKRPPAQVGGDQRARGLFLGIFEGHDTPFGVVGADVEPGTADHRHALRTASDAEAVRRPGMGGQGVGDVLCACADPHGLMAADVREDVHATEQGRGASDQRCRAREGLRRDAGHPSGGMRALERLQQAQRQLLLGGTLLLDSGVLGFHAVHKSPLIYKVIEKEGL